MNILGRRKVIRKTIIFVISIVINCVLFYVWTYSNLLTIKYKKFEGNYSFILDFIPIIIPTAVISLLIDKKNRIWSF